MQSNNKFYNAHSTSLTHPLPHAHGPHGRRRRGFQAARRRYKSYPVTRCASQSENGEPAVALKVLRRRIKEILAATWKNPGRQLSDREKEWWGPSCLGVFEERFEKEEKVRERSAGKCEVRECVEGLVDFVCRLWSAFLSSA